MSIFEEYGAFKEFGKDKDATKKINHVSAH